MGMSRQQEDYKKLASEIFRRAERETGPYRDVLLGVAEGYAALALHQGVFDAWPQSYPVLPDARSQLARPGVSQTVSQLARPAVPGRQANENGRPSRPSAAA